MHAVQGLGVAIPVAPSLRPPYVVLLIAASALLLGIFAARGWHTACAKSLTADEPHYIGTGLYLWETGDYHYASSLKFHPPLAYHLASVPLLSVDLDNASLEKGLYRQIREKDPQRAETVRIRSRMAFVALACWGGILLLAWATEAAGPVAGLIALALYTLSPTILANAPLAHSDITVTVFYLKTLYMYWRWQRRPTRGRLILCGLSLGLALTSKLSALLLLPILGILFLTSEHSPVMRRADVETRSEAIRDRLAALIRQLPRAATLLTACTFTAIGVLWLVYGGSLAVVEGAYGPMEGVRLPGYLHSFFVDADLNARGRLLFFLGEHSKSGWWYFFPAMYLLKTPFPTLLLLGLALLFGGPLEREVRRVLVVAISFYLFIASFVLQVPLGFRYVLPLVPLVHLLIATRIAGSDRNWLRPVAAVGLVALAWVGARAHPHYLSFFNPILGGSQGAYRYIAESNIDWGQDLGTLARYLDQRGNPPMKLAYFGPEPPERYGIEYERLVGCQPTDGLIAISVTVAQRLWNPANPWRRLPEGCYDWLLKREPVAQPGYSILVYEVENTEN